MKTVGHFYLSRGSGQNPTLRQGLSLEDLLDENEGFEKFAHDVWYICEKDGFYDDSDMPDTISIYYFEE